MVGLVFAALSRPQALQAAPSLTGASASYGETAGHPSLAAVPLQRPDGTPGTLADFKGKVVLLNLWATWCAPCVKEMPTLDALQAALGGDRFQVVTVSEDRAAPKVVPPFLASRGLGHLAAWSDPKGAAMAALKVQGLPTTVLIDADGHELGRLEGDADWSSPQAQALVRHYLGR